MLVSLSDPLTPSFPCRQCFPTDREGEPMAPVSWVACVFLMLAEFLVSKKISVRNSKLAALKNNFDELVV